jgi:hypothetical protein
MDDGSFGLRVHGQIPLACSRVRSRINPLVMVVVVVVVVVVVGVVVVVMVVVVVAHLLVRVLQRFHLAALLEHLVVLLPSRVPRAHSLDRAVPLRHSFNSHPPSPPRSLSAPTPP